MLEDITGQKIYGTHSASSGSTSGPSIVSVCLRCGWSLGGVQDRYCRYEAAGDQDLGRVVVGLPQNNSKSLHCHLTLLITERISFRIVPLKMFPSMVGDTHIVPVLHLCLASLAHHAEYLRRNISQKHPLLSSYIFRCPDIMVKLQGMLTTNENSWMRATGIPPHVELFQNMLKLELHYSSYLKYG
ncbi:hypothetical protein PHMEG_00027345 [Phytophthora megakarya]|uniref:Uncharacterized protein n=1 Tax=Phytophthora megakarya TaxID=4795 RepID=A0A225V932_9STRA|nr:hypothetical protein PHMEG_00027345 [Phytophthora megakarya]